MISLTIFLISAFFCIGAYSKQCKVVEADFDHGEAVMSHNYYRNLFNEGKVPGQPMPKYWISPLEFDSTLSNEALRTARTCNYSKIQHVDDERFPVGQSFAWTAHKDRARGIDWNHTVTSLYNNYKTYKFPDVRLLFNKHNKYPLIRPSNAYTQIVWPNTRFVGCAYAIFHEGDDESTIRFAVCNYGPVGNILAPYEASPLSDFMMRKG